MTVLLFSKKVCYPVCFFHLSFRNIVFWIFEVENSKISLFLILGSIFFISVSSVVIAKSRTSHDFFGEFFRKKWHLIPSSIFFLVTFKVLILSSTNFCNPSSLFTNTSLDNISSKSFLNASLEKCLYDLLFVILG